MTNPAPVPTLLGVATATALALAACSPTVSPASTPDFHSEATTTATPTAAATATATETATPETDRPAPSPTRTPESAFEDPQECENEEFGFEVEYPGDWWANDEVEAEDPVANIAACTFFAPDKVDLEPGTDDLSGVAIRFDLVERDVEPDGEILEEEETSVDDHDARIIEFEPEAEMGFVEEGARMYRYEIELEDGGHLFVTTDTIYQDEAAYEESKDVLDSMMETLEIDD